MEAQEEGWTARSVRSTFRTFFTDKGHSHYPPSSVVPPAGDDSLLFTNSGMVQFKKIFMGGHDNPDLHHACNSQLCIRVTLPLAVSAFTHSLTQSLTHSRLQVGGKHNDIEDVGRDGYHHTLFEMLGNWSFRCSLPNWKEEAIAYAWDLLTNIYGLNPDRLYVTYFGGNEEVEVDIETRDLWRKYLPDQRVLPFPAKQNFWEMGDSGPCGPCTEIHYDRVGGRFVPELVNADDPELIELWNIVFMQYWRSPQDAKISKLPQRHVDTGMGFERLVSVLQNKSSNYDTDIFSPIFEIISRFTDRRYGGRFGDDDAHQVDTAFRIIADHARCVAVMIHDGVIPGNKGRRHMVRRMIRRAVMNGRYRLGISQDTWFADVVGAVFDKMQADGMGSLHSERRHTILAVVILEESAFGRCLRKGARLFERSTSKLNPGDALDRDLVHRLHDTNGLYEDVVQLMALQKGFMLPPPKTDGVCSL